MILKDILETVGNTPIVKLNKIGNSLNVICLLNVNFLILEVQLRIELESK